MKLYCDNKKSFLVEIHFPVTGSEQKLQNRLLPNNKFFKNNKFYMAYNSTYSDAILCVILKQKTILEWTP